MRKNHFIIVLIILTIMTMVILPAQAFAADKIIQIPVSESTNIKNNTPPVDGVSDDLYYSEGFVITRSSVAGFCSISKLSSTSLSISGYTTCSPSDPAIKITLKLQAYYDGAWHTMDTISKQQSGTRVDLSQTYTVTSGYYYRTYAIHSIADGTTTSSYTNGLLIN